MLIGLLLALAAIAGVIPLCIWLYRQGRSDKARAVSALLLDPTGLGQVADPTRRKAAAYIEEMRLSHDREDESDGDLPPEAEEARSFERQVERQLNAPEAYLRRRGARGKPTENGARL